MKTPEEKKLAYEELKRLWLEHMGYLDRKLDAREWRERVWQWISFLSDDAVKLTLQRIPRSQREVAESYLSGHFPRGSGREAAETAGIWWAIYDPRPRAVKELSAQGKVRQLRRVAR